MIFGTLIIDGEALHTHRDTYLVKGLSVISVRRPFLPIGATIAAGAGGFGAAYADLLWSGELAAIAALSTAALVAGLKVGQLNLLSRDLRGSELMGAIYGTYGHLNRLRREIVAAKRRVLPEASE